MRNLSILRVSLLSLAVGLAAAILLYKHAWRIPVMQNLRDIRLFIALWMTATPVAALLTAVVRVARWRSALISGAICIGVSAPLYGLGSSFQKVRTSSQDKAVLCNIRQLAAAADQFFLENGTTVVRYEDLVGPDKYVKSLRTIAGEDYLANFPFRRGGILSAEFPNGRIINYADGPTPPDYKDTFEATDPRPSWRKVKSDSLSTPGTKTALAAQALSDAELKRELGKPVHKVRRGAVCANCHEKKH